MASASRRPTAQVDADGVRMVVEARMRRIVWGAVALIGTTALLTAGVLLFLRAAPAPDVRAAAPASTPASTPDVSRSPPPTAGTGSPAAPAPAARATRRASRGATTASEPTAAPAAPEAPALSARDVIPWLRSQGVRDGIAVFPPPGTDPPKSGIIVPDDFVLPEGYVRHFQVTDDGEELPPILMFHPDFEFVGADGQPLTLPADRVVTPELAPPGLPIRMLELKPPAEARPRTP